MLDRPKPISALRYDADLLGNITQVLAGLQGYETMALELLQNADDAGAHEIRFDIRNDRLIVTHDSEFSSCGLESDTCAWRQSDTARRCDFHGISLMASAGKARDAGQIGRFGIGFVSVYQITDRPTLRSAGIALTLDPLTRDNLIERFEGGSGTRIELPWASSQSPTRKAIQSSATPADVCERVQAALLSVAREGLLFLRGLARVEIARSGNVLATFAIARSESEVSVTVGDTIDRWFILRGDADPCAVKEEFEQLAELQRSTEVRLAFRLETDVDRPGRLYAFLPTGQASGLPCHIQADFFPRPDRRSIVTTGGSHERAFNILLLKTAAELIAENIVELRDTLGSVRLWALLEAAYEAKAGDSSVDVYWPELEKVLDEAEVAETTDQRWLAVHRCLLPPADFSADEEAAAKLLGLPIVSEELKPRRNLMQVLRARPLTLAPVVDALATPGAATDIGLTPLDLAALTTVWKLVARLLTSDKSLEASASQVRLTAATFVPSRTEAPSTIDGLYRPPDGMESATVATFVPEAPLIHDAVREHEAIWRLTDVLTLSDVAGYLADGEPSADDRSGGYDHLENLVDWLAAFDPDGLEDEIASTLHEFPLLPCSGEVLPPSRALWPGGFSDPIGHLRLIDVDGFSVGAASFVKDVLGVEVLSFRRYLEDHLEDVMNTGPDHGAYSALIDEILRLEYELRDEDYERLRLIPLCRVESGRFVPASEAYERNEKNEALLGVGYPAFLDPSWLRPGGTGARQISLFERIGLGRRIAIRHLVQRLPELAQVDPEPAVRDAMNIVVKHMLDRAESWSEDDRASIETLADEAWVPGALDGTALSDWSFPADLQRPFRTETFASQLPLIDLPALRTSKAAMAFLDLIDAPKEVPTSAVVDHLIELSARGRSPMESVYALLNERLDGDRNAILELSGKPIIWHPQSERYVRADRIFWNPPPLRLYWAKALQYHARHEALFRALGVEDDPSVGSYGLLLKSISAADPGGLQGKPAEQMAVSAAWDVISVALADPMADAREVLDDLKSSPIFLTLGLTFAYADEIVWCDSAKLAEPFGEDIEKLVVAPPAANAAMLFRLLEIPALSEVVVLTPARAENPRPDEFAQASLRERSELLSWLAPTPSSAHRLSEALRTVCVLTVDTLAQRAEFRHEDSEIVSPSTTVEAFFDASDGSLYVRSNPGGVADWSSIFHALLPSLFRGDPFDLPRTILSAVLVMTAATLGDAERALRGSGLTAPEIRFDAPDDDPDDDYIEDFGDQDPELPADEVEFPTALAAERADEPTPPDRPDESSTFDDAQADVDREGSTMNTTGRETSPNTERPGEAPSRPNLSPASARRQRLRSYVSNAREEGSRTPAAPGGYDNAIDEGAMQAALSYERAAGRIPERQSHTNPGFDIVSTDPATGAKRVIEVKGLANEWTARGVKLSTTQFATAERHGDDYWLYVVEHAGQHGHVLTPLQNPFGKVEEYWFDDLWREQAEKPVAGRDLSFTAGRRVRHRLFGDGVLESVRKRGHVTDLVIAFADGTRKNLLMSKDIEVLED